MSKRHLRPEAGGDPARPPARLPDSARPSLGEMNDFPDDPHQDDGRPHADASGQNDAGRDQDQPDLDRFAERIGLASGGDDPDDDTSNDDTSKDDTSKDDAVREGDGESTTSKQASDGARWLVIESVREVVARSVGRTGTGLRSVATVLDRVAIRITPDQSSRITRE